MRKLTMPMIVMVLLVVGFFIGSSSQITGIAISSFCLWTPASIWLGWSLAKSGVRVAVVSASPPPPPTQKQDDMVRRAIKKVQEDMS